MQGKNNNQMQRQNLQSAAKMQLDAMTKFTRQNLQPAAKTKFTISCKDKI
jgi:hypothetical protein